MALQEQQYISGFNIGYILARYEPRLLAGVLQGIHTSTPYIQGLLFGKEEYEMSKTKNILAELKILREKNKKERDQNKE